jgi:hypothetical protein
MTALMRRGHKEDIAGHQCSISGKRETGLNEKRAKREVDGLAGRLGRTGNSVEPLTGSKGEVEG